MRIAIFHNFLDNIGGAEVVTLTLGRELSADIYTTNISEEKIAAMGFADIIGRIHSIGHVPKNAPWRQQRASRLFRTLDLNGKYDFFIIAGDWALASAVNNKPNLWYAHSPLNELWEFKSYIRNELMSAWKRPIYDLWVLINRRLSLSYAHHVGQFVTNSKNTKARLKKYYDKDAMIVYPPIDTKIYHTAPHDNYWLSVNRLFKNKRIEIQMDAMRLLPDEQLIIVGSYEQGSNNFESYRKYLESIKPANVTIKSWVGDQELKALYAKAKGFITTARDEDLGMTAIEAMASGKPVIAPNEGGYKETVEHGVNGILIDDISSDKLAKAISDISTKLQNNRELFTYTNLDKARSYDVTVFTAKIKDLIQI